VNLNANKSCRPNLVRTAFQLPCDAMLPAARLKCTKKNLACPHNCFIYSYQIQKWIPDPKENFLNLLLYLSFFPFFLFYKTISFFVQSSKYQLIVFYVRSCIGLSGECRTKTHSSQLHGYRSMTFYGGKWGCYYFREAW
jgi:hypothetical protein